MKLLIRCLVVNSLLYAFFAAYRRIGAALDHLISCNDIVQRHMVNVVTNQMFYWFFGVKLGGWGVGGIVFILPKIRREVS